MYRVEVKKTITEVYTFDSEEKLEEYKKSLREHKGENSIENIPVLDVHLDFSTSEFIDVKKFQGKPTVTAFIDGDEVWNNSLLYSDHTLSIKENMLRIFRSMSIGDTVKKGDIIELLYGREADFSLNRTFDTIKSISLAEIRKNGETLEIVSKNRYITRIK